MNQMTKQCELCNHPARMYCESDQASLCWDCDAKVHGANFLVARHTRCLLCRSCQAPTPWRASGSRLGPTVSVCERCLGAGGQCDLEKGATRSGGLGEVGNGDRMEREVDGMDDLGVEDDSEDDEEEGEDDEGEDGEEDGENQVVPWSMEAEASTATPPPSVASCSSSDDSSSGRTAICQGLVKRMRENANLSSSHWPEDLALESFTSHFAHRSSSPATAAVRWERMVVEYEESASSLGESLRTLNGRKRAALPSPASDVQILRDRLPRGASTSVDVFLPSCPSSPI